MPGQFYPGEGLLYVPEQIIKRSVFLDVADICIIALEGGRAVILSNESTFTTKHLNRFPVKTEMGRVSCLRNTQK